MMLRFASALTVSAAMLLVSEAAFAQSATKVNSGNWRQRDRRTHVDRYGSAQHFAFELRFGAYHPEVDEEFGGSGPYKQVFGDAQRFYFGLEFDWQALRIPYVGALGPGFGWGYTSSSAKAKFTDRAKYPDNPDTKDVDESESLTETSLAIMPMHLSAVLRLDELYRRTGIPVVPYGKFGIGMATWSAGDTEYAGGKITPSGVTWGLHLALGGMLALNWLSPRSSAAMDETSGVNHIYLFGEWMNANLDGLGSRPQMHVGSSTWVVGLAGDF